jgi:hypothetical protein
MAKDPLQDQTVPTEKMAKELSKILGCSGAHKVGEDAWGPCESPKDLKKLIAVGNPAFREWKKRQQKKKNFYDFLELKAKGKGKNKFPTREAAEQAASKMGCAGAHQTRQGVWAPCMTPEDYNAAHGHLSVGGSPVLRLQRPTRRVATDLRAWEKLRERGPRGIETLPGGGLVSAKSVTASDSFTPTKGMVAEAKRALEWRKEFKRGGTAVGIARARDIANGKNLPYKTVKRMKAFFDRHQSDAKADGFRPGEKGFPSNGRIAHALWGGDAGYTWAKNIVARVEGTEKSFNSIEEKRFYTRKRRMEYAKRGWALPDGSFPIRDVGDLRNAIQAYGLGKDAEAAKKHIMKRARALGRTELIPENWKTRQKAARRYGPNDPKTPAKPSERIRGSKRNKPGTASNTRGGIKLSAAVEASLKNKVKEHNEKMEKRDKPERKVTLGMLKAVWRRGAGAFSATHRPKMGRQQWAMGRVNAFLKLVSSGKPSNPKYTTDNDLLPKKHPRRTKS